MILGREKQHDSKHTRRMDGMGKVKIGEPNFIFSTKILKSDPHTNNTSWPKYNREREREREGHATTLPFFSTTSLSPHSFKSQPSLNS